MPLYRKDVRILIILWVFFIALFITFPTIDIITSSYFFDRNSGIFPLGNSPLVTCLNNFGRLFIVPVALWPLSVIIFPTLPFTLKQAILYVIFYTLSVFILIEYGIKEIWLRPRPEQITLFAGTQSFLPLFHSLPKGNFHSFVSGHASVWFGLICIGYTVYPQNKRFWTIVGLLMGSFMGFLRICIGAHFLSDTIFAGLFVCSACVILDITVTNIHRPPQLKFCI